MKSNAHVPGAQEVLFDDSLWETVSTPHSFNDVGFLWILSRFGLNSGVPGSPAATPRNVLRFIGITLDHSGSFWTVRGPEAKV